MRLEKFQRIGIYEALEAGGLDPRECDLSEDDAEARISHIPSGSHFTLGSSPLPWRGSYVVGDSALSTPYEAYAWTKVEEHVRRWAEKVKRDVDTPDPWKELQRERELFTGAGYADVANAPFTADEQAEIAEQLGEIKEYVQKTYSLSKEQTALMEAGFAELRASSRHLGRMTWRLTFLGVVFTFVVGGILPPDAVHTILVTVLHSLDHLFGGGGGAPLELPPIA
jgi:hypothetical protein